jgi:hypothetical protein
MLKKRYICKIRIKGLVNYLEFGFESREIATEQKTDAASIAPFQVLPQMRW